MSTPKIFISYRREETAGHTGRLYDAVAAQFGEAHVFVDVGLAPGTDFVESVRNAIAQSRVLLVMMGPRWATVADEDGESRLADPDDFVRLEVETALRRSDVTVIPVLVGGAQMPVPEELPEGVRPLARRNAFELSDLRWRYDVGRLNDALEELLRGTTAVHEVPPPQPARLRSRFVSPTARLLLGGMLVAGLAGMLGRLVGAFIPLDGLSTTAGDIADVILQRTVNWAVVGAALAAWLSFVRGDGRLPAKNRVLLGLGIGGLAGALGHGALVLVLELPDPRIDQETIKNISIAAFAITGAVLGGLLGALWTPRSVAPGLAAGLIAGAIVRVLWNLVGWTGASLLQEAFAIGIQSMLIVGLILGALQAFTAQPRSVSAPVPASAGPNGQ